MSYCCKDKFKLQEVGDSFQLLQGGSVTSVNGKVGAVVLTAEDVGALPDTYEAPVTSVNTQTGDVVLDAGDIAYESTTVEEELGTINSALSSLSSVTEIIDTASGAIASFPDGSGLPMRSLVAEIEPVQDLHGYEYPWYAGGGKNKWNGKFVTATYSELESFSGTCYAGNSAMPITVGKTYTASKDGTTKGIRCRFLDENKSPIGDLVNVDTTEAAPNNAVYLQWRIRDEATSADEKFQIEEGSSATAWTPYSNQCPITGWTGLSIYERGLNIAKLANAILQNDRTQNGITFHATSDNSVQISGTATGSAYLTEAQPYATLVSEGKFYKAGTYTLSSNLPRNSKNNYAYMTGNKVNGEQIRNNIVGSVYAGHPSSFTIDYDFYANIQIVIQSGETIDENVWVQLEPGSVAHAYEAFKGIEPISVSWQSEAGTVYGGTVDVVSGVLTVDRVTKTLDGDSDIQDWQSFAGAVGYNASSTQFPDAHYFKPILCNKLQTLPPSQSLTYGACKYTSSGSFYFWFQNGAFSSKADAKSKVAAADIQCVYYLLRPQTYQLTPQQISTLIGNNTVFVDCGSVSVTYQASIKGYIDKVLGS